MNSLSKAVGATDDKGRPLQISEDDFAKREEAIKYIERLKANDAFKKDLKAVSAIDAIAGGYPSDLNTTKGIAKLLSGMMVETSREIDKNNFYQQFRTVAERGKVTGGAPNRSGAFANLEERFAKDRAAVESKEKQGLENMYLQTPTITRDGKTMYYGQKGNLISKDDIARGIDRPMSWAEVAVKKGADLTPNQKSYIQKTFGYNPEKGTGPSILRHFGM
jgi:hypothetical protein